MIQESRKLLSEETVTSDKKSNLETKSSGVVQTIETTQGELEARFLKGEQINFSLVKVILGEKEN